MKHIVAVEKVLIWWQMRNLTIPGQFTFFGTLAL